MAYFGGGAGGGGGDGGFWSRIFSPANIVVQIGKLSGFKRYTISDIRLFDLGRGSAVGTDSLFEMVTIRPGGFYNRVQLQKEVENLETCGMFEKVDLKGKVMPDGTLAVTIYFVESTWQSADKFRCINVGLMPQTKPNDADGNISERDYRRRIEKARPCLLPTPVYREILHLLQSHERVSARMLQKIRARVHKWYHDEGYACAQVVNFGNLNTEEVVCEVDEGDITQLVIQFQDKLGNVVERNTQIPVVMRELPEQLRPGHVFNIEAGKQALRNINSLALFSNIELSPRLDEKNDGGIIVEITLKELEQKTAEVSSERSIVPRLGGRPTLVPMEGQPPTGANFQPC